MPQFLDITCSGVLLQDNLFFTTKLRLIFETAAFFIKIITPYGTGGAENDVQMRTNRVRMRKKVAEKAAQRPSTRNPSLPSSRTRIISVIFW
jgi:hypothetical protein